MDPMLQMRIMGYDTDDLYIPTGIQKLVINPMLHNSKLRNNANGVETTTNMDERKCSLITSSSFEHMNIM